MFRLIRADLYKIVHRIYFYVMMLALSGLCIMILYTLHRSGGQLNSVYAALQLAADYLVFPVMLLPLLTSIVLDEEYREHVLKNTLSYGANRSLLFASKFLTTVLLGLILLAMTLAVYLGGAMLVLPSGTLPPAAMQEFFTRIAAGCVVYIATLAMAAFFSTVFHRGSLWIFLFYGVFFLSNWLLKLFHLSSGIEYLLKTQIYKISADPVNALSAPIIISLATLALFYLAGNELFRRKDIC